LDHMIMGSFRRLTIITLIAVYLLILVGGIVRSTGSGMGCPDWPRCFGNWIPPTSVSQLPPDYKAVYATYRHKKNLKFAKYLRTIGLDDTANRIVNDRTVLYEADFNPVKTWVEYFNRIIGVIIGLMIMAVAIVSVKSWRTDMLTTILAFLTLFLVAFQGWIGSFVVSTNLTPWTVTVHMFLALVIVALLVYLIERSNPVQMTFYSPLGFWWLMACIGVLLVQILLGTRVREEIDRVVNMFPRDSWIEAIGQTFTLHRSFSWIVVILHAGLIVNLWKTEGLKSFQLVLILLILGTILVGVGMAYFSVPAFLQPVHLLFATVSFGMQFMLLLRLKGNVKNALAS
jgi:heme a synthase